MFKKIILTSFIIAIILGCHEIKESKKINIDGVIYALFNDVTTTHIEYAAFPAPPFRSDINLDSIVKENKKKDTIAIIRNLLRKRGKYIVAINTSLEPPYTKNIKKDYIKGCLVNDFENIYEDFKKIKDTLNIDITNIPLNDYAYILPYQTYYSKMPRRGFDKYNMILSITNITFNKDFTKAITIMGVSLGRLNGYSAIYFLEKKKDKWIIKCEKGLTIS